MRLDGEQEIRSSFGFIANPSLSVWDNAKSVLGLTSTKKYFSEITNTAHHDLCSIRTPPNGIGSLLGLGMKYCLKSTRPNKMSLASAFARLRRDVRLKYIFGGDEDVDYNDIDTYNKKLYIKSEWQPDAACTSIENRIDRFEQTLTAARESIILNTRPSTNLSVIQQQHLKLLRNHPEFIILDSDKNLGPCIIERDVYIKNVLVEHLNTKTYEQISHEEATDTLNKLLEEISDLLFEYNRCLNDGERTYFDRGLKLQHRISQFYGTAKVHKVKSPGDPIPFRPVISQVGSLASIPSKYIDYYLGKLLPFIPGYVQNSLQVIDLVNDCSSSDLSDPNTYITTSDAMNMYGNIDPQEGIETIQKYVDLFAIEYKGHFPKKLIIELLSLVMTMNIFKFGDTWWKQIIGTAMGTSCACVYATIFFAYYERTSLLPVFEDNLVLYVRYIDDIFLVWKETQRNQFKNFTKSLNDQCKLTWVTEKLCTSVNFLDLTIMLDRNAGRFWTRTYQKDMNLFLYIPALSAHPPGLLKSLIYGLLETYWFQNSNSRDYTKFSQLLHKRLIARGHDLKTINVLFTEAAAKIEEKSFSKTKRPKLRAL